MTIQIKQVVMVCSRCMKDQSRITWFDSGDPAAGSNEAFDNHLASFSPSPPQ